MKLRESAPSVNTRIICRAPAARGGRMEEGSILGGLGDLIDGDN
jgi:hypothetical protein